MTHLKLHDDIMSRFLNLSVQFGQCPSSEEHPTETETIDALLHFSTGQDELGLVFVTHGGVTLTHGHQGTIQTTKLRVGHVLRES